MALKVLIYALACFASTADANRPRTQSLLDLFLAEQDLRTGLNVHGLRRLSARQGQRSNRKGIRMNDAVGQGSAFTEKELAALKEASISKKKPFFAGEEGKPASLKNLLDQPDIYFSLLRNPNRDPPEEVWDYIRKDWPELEGRTNAELNEALKPIKAVKVDIRSL
jgi:hypothetical protein